MIVSEKGGFSARFYQEIDILLTQKLITQSYFQAEIFTKDVEESDIKSGQKAGLIIRYEIHKNLHPILPCATTLKLLLLQI